jgi:glycine/D-amino acid oxidase-like deaminating enzyme
MSREPHRGSPWVPVDVQGTGGVPARDVDVAVVGGGITGLLTATLLASAGARVLVLDRGPIGGRATANTTAKISALQGTVYRTITAYRGEEVAAAYAAAQLDALAGYRALAHDLGVPDVLTEASAFTYATEASAAERAHDEHEVARACGVPTRWVTQTELPFEVSGAVRLDGQLHFDPGVFCAALARRLGPDGVAGARPAVAVDERRDGCTVTLGDGVTIAAAHVVVATQGPVFDPGLLANRCRPVQSYAIAARVRAPVPAGLYLSCDSTVRSLRPATVAGEEAIVVGGEGHDMGDAAATPARWDALERWTDGAFGEAETTHRWGTHDLVPTDHVPFIGRLRPGAERRWVATGFAKWGMTNAYVAAKLISEAIAGREVEWQFAFDSTRVLPSVTKELVTAGVSVAARLVVDRLARRPEPRCTHQGCVLRRDEALGTWDCACHGSRFADDGEVLQGPANRRLDLA